MNIIFDNQNMIVHNEDSIIIVDFAAHEIRRYLNGERVEVISFRSGNYSLDDLQKQISEMQQ